jgi:hypothetical protein
MKTPEFTPDAALAFLRSRNVDLQEFANRPEVFDRTCSFAYKALPLPIRIAVGKDRLRHVLGAARDLYLAQGIPSLQNTPSTEGT